LMPKPYNHPVRTAESVAVLDLLSDGRVDFGTGRSSTRAELEGFGIDPQETRAMWQEAIEAVVGCWTNDEYAIEGKFWRMPARRVHPKPLQQPHPPLWGATSSDEGHRQVGGLGLGLCSFAVGVSPETVKAKIDIYREAVGGCSKPIGRFINNRAATFTMALCAPTQTEAWQAARESFEWYPRAGARHIATLAEWMSEQQRELGNYAYAADMKMVSDTGALDLLTLEYLTENGACVLGTPEQCIATCKRYEAAGVDLLLCLVNPYKIPHAKVLQTIELMGKHVIPAFRA
jgi:alkanesulfonate monooxygenase SsuD/methylene tetrahydromethanopterin reductase-like flavin-dependent oxidoreductase (luciferase family)